MKKTIVVLFVVILSCCSVFAGTKQFYSISNFGGYGFSTVKKGDQSTSGNLYSLGFEASAGWENEDYNFGINIGMGIDRVASSISYSHFFKNSLFASAEAAIVSPYDIDNLGVAFSFGGVFGISFTGIGNSWANIGLTIAYSYQNLRYINASMSMMKVGLLIDEVMPINDSISMSLGMNIGSIPLFVTLKDKQSGSSVSLSVSEFSFVLRAGIKYSFPADYSTTPKLRTH